MLGPICVEQRITDSFIQLIEEIYIPKQKSFKWLQLDSNPEPLSS